MQRAQFKIFVEKSLQDVVAFTEQETGTHLPDKICFRWMFDKTTPVTDNIADYIVHRLYIDAEHIAPCVDIGIQDWLDNGSLLIVASVSGHPPRPFGQNWTGRNGPFIYVLWPSFLEKLKS